MIAAAVLLAGFTAYQLWGTGLETAAAQRRLDTEFSAMLAEAERPAPAIITGSTVPTVGSTVSTVPDTATVAPDPAEASARPPREPVPGAPVAFLEIPRLGLDEVVVSGVGDEELRSGPGHFRDTPQPGRPGRAAIAGHRTTYGQPFRSIDDLVVGDEIITTTVTGRYVYRVVGTEIVEPADYSVVANGDPTTAELVLVSCHPVFSTAQRIVVTAVLDPQISDPLEPEHSEAAVSTTPTVAAGATTSSTTDTTASATTSSAMEVTTSATSDGTGTTPIAGTEVDLDGAFGRGWFGDLQAGVATAIWGTAMAAIAIGSWLLSRRTGRNRIGALVGVVPFTIATLMFYRGLDGVLPAGL